MNAAWPRKEKSMRPVDVDVHQLPHRHPLKLTRMSGGVRQIGDHMAADVFLESRYQMQHVRRWFVWHGVLYSDWFSISTYLLIRRTTPALRRASTAPARPCRHAGAHWSHPAPHRDR